MTTAIVERPPAPDVGTTRKPHRGRMTRRRTKKALRYVVIVVVCIVALFPIYWMFLSSVQPSQYELTWPPSLFFRGFQWSSFSTLFEQNPIASWLVHSATASLVCVGITLVFCHSRRALLLAAAVARGRGLRVPLAVHPADAGSDDPRP